MHCNILVKWWHRLPFPGGITLIEAVEIIKKYIEREGKNERKF